MPCQVKISLSIQFSPVTSYEIKKFYFFMICLPYNQIPQLCAKRGVKCKENRHSITSQNWAIYCNSAFCKALPRIVTLLNFSTCGCKWPSQHELLQGDDRFGVANFAAFNHREGVSQGQADELNILMFRCQPAADIDSLCLL